MRHNKKFNHLGRTNTHRDAMLSNMACSLIQLTLDVWYLAICKTNLL